MISFVLELFGTLNYFNFANMDISMHIKLAFRENVGIIQAGRKETKSAK